MFYSTSSWPFALALFPSLYLFSLSFCVYYQSHFFQFVFLSLLFSVLSVFVTLPSFFISNSLSLSLSPHLSPFSIYFSHFFQPVSLYVLLISFHVFSISFSAVSLTLPLLRFFLHPLSLSPLSLSLSPFSHIN